MHVCGYVAIKLIKYNMITVYTYSYVRRIHHRSIGVDLKQSSYDRTSFRLLQISALQIRLVLATLYS